MNEYGYCPFCGTDLDGEDIIDSLVKKGKTLTESHIYAMVYFGYKEGNTKVSRVINLYNPESKRSYGCQCPDCKNTW